MQSNKKMLLIKWKEIQYWIGEQFIKKKIHIKSIFKW